MIMALLATEGDKVYSKSIRNIMNIGSQILGEVKEVEVGLS